MSSITINNYWNYEQTANYRRTFPLRSRVTQCFLGVVHCFCHMCRSRLDVVLWLLISTYLCLLFAELSTAWPLCPSKYLYGTIKGIWVQYFFLLLLILQQNMLNRSCRKCLFKHLLFLCCFCRPQIFRPIGENLFFRLFCQNLLLQYTC